jgi:hypothetical protein
MEITCAPSRSATSRPGRGRGQERALAPGTQMPEPWHEVDAAMKRDDVENDQDRALRPFFDVNRVNGDIAVGKRLAPQRAMLGCRARNRAEASGAVRHGRLTGTNPAVGRASFGVGRRDNPIKIQSGSTSCRSRNSATRLRQHRRSSPASGFFARRTNPPKRGSTDTRCQRRMVLVTA